MKIICIGRNYAEHAAELHEQLNDSGKLPEEPMFFLKPDTALLRNNDPFYIPSFSQEVHYECELVVRINRVGKAIASSGGPSPRGFRGRAARLSTARRQSRRNSSPCRSWAATCSGCTSRST